MDGCLHEVGVLLRTCESFNVLWPAAQERLPFSPACMGHCPSAVIGLWCAVCPWTAAMKASQTDPRVRMPWSDSLRPDQKETFTTPISELRFHIHGRCKRNLGEMVNLRNAQLLITSICVLPWAAFSFIIPVFKISKYWTRKYSAR